MSLWEIMIRVDAAFFATLLRNLKGLDGMIDANGAARKSAPVPVVQAHAAGFVVGDQVKHKIFGIGVVVSKRHDALTIRFGKTGIREIRADFVVAG